MITPRPRQAKAIEDLRTAYRQGFKAPILIAPTGFGKSATAICMIQSALDKGKRVWFIAHLKEILNDTSGRLTEAGIPHGWIASGRDGNHRLLVQVAMVQTLVRHRGRSAPGRGQHLPADFRVGWRWAQAHTPGWLAPAAPHGNTYAARRPGNGRGRRHSGANLQHARPDR
jgi:superfamily II DNA or RNA helicase